MLSKSSVCVWSYNQWFQSEVYWAGLSVAWNSPHLQHDSWLSFTPKIGRMCFSIAFSGLVTWAWWHGPFWFCAAGSRTDEIRKGTNRGGQDSEGKGRATARGQGERALKSSQVVRTGRPRGHIFLSVILERAVLGKTIVIFKKTSKLRIFQMEIIDQ